METHLATMADCKDGARCPFCLDRLKFADEVGYSASNILLCVDCLEGAY